MDLTPRPEPRRRRRHRRVPNAILLSVTAIAVVFVLFKFLTSATMYFCDANQVGVKAECSGAKRFRLRGAVVAGTVKSTADGVNFDVTLNERTIHVEHTGSPPDLFREGIQVVVEGKLVSSVPDTFSSDVLLVKHSEEYRKKNPGRVPADGP